MSPPSNNPIIIRRSPRSMMASFLLLIGLVSASVYLTVRFDWSIQTISLGMWSGRNIFMPLPLFALIPFGLLGYIGHGLYNCKYIICDDYVLEIRGLVEIRRKSIRLNYTHIRGVEISESIWQQLWRVADVHVLSDVSALSADHMSDGYVQMKGVTNAHRIKDLIQSRIQSRAH